MGRGRSRPQNGPVGHGPLVSCHPWSAMAYPELTPAPPCVLSATAGLVAAGARAGRGNFRVTPPPRHGIMPSLARGPWLFMRNAGRWADRTGPTWPGTTGLPRLSLPAMPSRGAGGRGGWTIGQAPVGSRRGRRKRRMRTRETKGAFEKGSPCGRGQGSGCSCGCCV